MDHVHGAEELILLAPLLGADEKHLLGELLGGVAAELVLFECQRQRLLTEDMLAGLEGLDGDLHVPVVGGDDADDVDVLALENLAIIAGGVGFPLADVGILTGPRRVAVVDVTDSKDVTELGVLLGVAGAHRTGADAADPGAVVGGIVGECFRGPGEGRDEAPGEGGGTERRRTEELTARGASVARHGGRISPAKVTEQKRKLPREAV